MRKIVEGLCKKFNIGDVDSDDNKNWGMIGSLHPIIFDYGIEGYDY